MATASTRSKKRSKESKANGQPVPRREVLTLAEAATFLRVAQADIVELAAREELPGRQIGKEWRFLKAALADWLRQPTRKSRLMRLAGTFHDDPYLERMVHQIYEERGRPMTDDE